MFRAFNRWLAEDWGCNHRDRIFAAPVHLARRRRRRRRRARMGARPRRPRRLHAPGRAHHRAGPAARRRDPAFDPFWARVNEAGHHRRRPRGRQRLPVERLRARRLRGHVRRRQPARRSRCSTWSGRSTTSSRRSCSTGCSCASPTSASRRWRTGRSSSRDLFRKLRSASRKLPGFFAEDPVETFRRHIWVNPFWEDDVNEVVELMGADRVIFGSDWPHIEGMAAPARLRGRAEGVRRRRRSAASCATTPPRSTSCAPLDVVI